MDKNEELQKWLNDDRYVQGKELADIWNIAAGSVRAFLKKNNVKIQKKIYIGRKGMFVFYSKQECNNARLRENNKREDLEKWMNDDDYVQLSDVEPMFEMSRTSILSLLRKNNIAPVKTINVSASVGMFTFYCKKKIENLLKTRDLQKKEVGELMRRPECIQIQELSKIWECSISAVRNFLSYNKIKPIKHIQLGGGINNYVFYDRDTCISMRLKPNQDYCQCIRNDRMIETKDLSLLWNLTIQDTGIFLNKHKIKAIKKIGSNGRGVRAFYDRAECERARPFINQSEQKEVEQVENIEELATATKHQILIEACADDFVWDKVTMKNKIMPVKNYCDERGNFVSLFKKDETVSAILAYKNEQKQLLEKCLADKNLVTTKELVKIWNLDKSAVYNKIYRLTIKPCAKIKLDNGSMWHFYKKADCIESQEVEKVEEKQMELPKPKEQTPDIIPADTIDLLTMSELESELKQRGVELTAEVRNKISASDMPEMQHIATMLRGNAKSIAIRLSVLNEIAGQLKNTDDILNAEAEIGLKDESQFNMPLSDIAESANMTKDKARYWLKLADCSPIIKDRVDLWPIQSVNLLKDMNAYVENGMTPNAAAAMLKKDGQNNKTTPTDDQSDSEFTSIRIGKAERQKLRIMAVENRSGITEQLHLIINSLFGLTYRK